MEKTVYMLCLIVYGEVRKYRLTFVHWDDDDDDDNTHFWCKILHGFSTHMGAELEHSAHNESAESKIQHP